MPSRAKPATSLRVIICIGLSSVFVSYRIGLPIRVKCGVHDSPRHQINNGVGHMLLAIATGYDHVHASGTRFATSIVLVAQNESGIEIAGADSNS